MLVKTSELEGGALDWAVAKCENETVKFDPKHRDFWIEGGPLDSCDTYYSPATVWAQGGPIIERERITVSFNPDYEVWEVDITNQAGDEFIVGHGPTPLIAAMRCYVASKLGDEVNIPEGL